MATSGRQSSGEYANVHQWMRRHYPLTGRCEWCGCTDRLTQRARGRGDRLTKNPADWFEFCGSCHHKFDQIDHAARGRLGGLALKGRKKRPLSAAHKQAISQSMKRYRKEQRSR